MSWAAHSFRYSRKEPVRSDTCGMACSVRASRPDSKICDTVAHACHSTFHWLMQWHLARKPLYP